MSLSLVTRLPSFSFVTSSSSSSSPRPLRISCNHNNQIINKPEDNRLKTTTPRRTALIALGVLSTAPFSNQGLLASGSSYSNFSNERLLATGSRYSNMFPEFGSEPRPLSSVIRVLVPRPPKLQTQDDEGEEKVEVLVVKGVEVQNSKPVKFDVYIAQPEGPDDDDEKKGGLGLGQLAGSLVELGGQKLRKLGRFMLVMDWVLEEIGAEDCDKLVVSLVPRFGDAVIDEIYIDYV